MTMVMLLTDPTALLPMLNDSEPFAVRRILTALLISGCLLLALTPRHAMAQPVQTPHQVKKKAVSASKVNKTSIAKSGRVDSPQLSYAALQRAKNRDFLRHHPGKVVATNYGDAPVKTASLVDKKSSAAQRQHNRLLMAQHPDWFSHQQREAVRLNNNSGGDSIALAYRDHLQQTTQKAMSTLMNQLGKPYVWGGTSPGVGFDCSGLVYFAYHNLLTDDMPRTANGMYRQARGKTVAQNQLKRGDLIFFHIHTRINADHVGVYIGNGQFIESPRTGEEIRISMLNEPFWQDHYLGAKRVLTPETII